MFGTSGIRGPVGETVTADLGVRIGAALAGWGADRVVVGRDPRPSGAYLADAVAAGLRQSGAAVVDVGMAATPTIARAVGWRDADAGVAVTASHNPAADNGFKLWLPSGQAFPPAEQAAIEDRLRAIDESSVPSPAIETVPDRQRWAASSRHADALVDAVDIDTPLDVVVDVGNGAGQVTAAALDRLGCQVRTLNGQPDGRFPGRPSEPTAEHCRDLRRTVPAIGADLGIAHDGDADRMLAVDDEGTFLPGDVLLAVFARDALDGDGVIAAPIDTSLAVDDAIEGRGTVSRTRVGDVFVADRVQDPDVVFGGEPSGAWIWPEETLCPDGPLAACRLTALVARDGPLGDLAGAVETYPIRRRSLEVADKPETMREVNTTITDRYDEADIQTLDGIRVETPRGWFLIRPSGTEPVVRVTAEARDGSQADALLEEAMGVVRTHRDSRGS